MGGFCVNNISHYEHPNIIGAVSMASFNDSKTLFDDIITRSISNQAILLSKIMTSIEHSYNKEISDISSLKSLENVTYPMLMISGDKDEVVYPKSNYELFKNKFEHSELFEFILMPDRGHRPNISISATEYCKEVDKKIAEFNKLPSKEKTEEHKKTLYQSFDYRKMVEFDMEVMNKVLNFYKKCKKY